MPNFVSQHMQEEVVSNVNFLLRDLLKIIKVLSLYPPDNPLPKKMRASVGGRFVELVSLFDGLHFTVRANELLYQDKVVFTDTSKEEALGALFFQAGIISLEFCRGLPGDEFNTFLDILKEYVNDRSPERDLVSLLWQEQFDYIKFSTVEDIILNAVDSDVSVEEIKPYYGTDDGGDAGVDYNSIFLDEIDAGEEAIVGGEEAGEGFAPVNEELIEAARQMGMPSLTAPADSQPLSLLIKDGYTLADEDQQEVRRLLEENRYFDPNRAAARIILETLRIWTDRKAFLETVSICEKILDELLVNGAFAVAADFVHSLRSLQRELDSTQPTFAERLDQYLRRAGDQKRVARLTEVINSQSRIDTASIEIYLESLGRESLNHITEMLGNLVAQEARMMVCKYLADHGRDNVAIIANDIRSRHWYVVRNTVMVLGRIGSEECIEYLKLACDHTDNRVRGEVVQALANINSESAVDQLSRFLRDNDAEIRLRSLRYLEKIGGRRTFENLWNLVVSPEFSDFSLEEQQWYLIAISRLGGSEVVDVLGRIIGAIRIFGGARSIRFRLAALTALVHNRSDEAERMILKFSCSRRRWLREAASAALEQQRRLLYGGGDDDFE